MYRRVRLPGANQQQPERMVQYRRLRDCFQSLAQNTLTVLLPSQRPVHVRLVDIDRYELLVAPACLNIGLLGLLNPPLSKMETGHVYPRLGAVGIHSLAGEVLIECLLQGLAKRRIGDIGRSHIRQGACGCQSDAKHCIAQQRRDQLQARGRIDLLQRLDRRATHQRVFGGQPGLNRRKSVRLDKGRQFPKGRGARDDRRRSILRQRHQISGHAGTTLACGLKHRSIALMTKFAVRAVPLVECIDGPLVAAPHMALAAGIRHPEGSR